MSYFRLNITLCYNSEELVFIIFKQPLQLLSPSVILCWRVQLNNEQNMAKF
jgi:hypothetical protein